jgi:hypothetical protein
MSWRGSNIMKRVGGYEGVTTTGVKICIPIYPPEN